MPREEAFEHAREQERAAPLVRELVEFQHDLDAGAEAQRPLERQPPHDRARCERAHAVGLARPAHVLGWRIQPEHRAQRRGRALGRFADQRQVVQRQVADKTPAEFADGPARDWPRRPAHGIDAQHWPRPVEPPLRRRAFGHAVRQQRRQVAVADPGRDRKLADVFSVRRVLRVDQREVDLLADVRRAHPLLLLPLRHQPRLAPHRVEAVRLALRVF